ncbi:MAG: hypothetical protein ACJ8AB_01805 [Gemmatimonadaceae bacterium]
MKSCKSGGRIAPRVEHDETRARAQSYRHQLVARTEGQNGTVLTLDPGGYVRRE